MLALLSLPDTFSWKVALSAVEIDVAPYVAKTLAHAKEVDQADALVTTHPDIMGGAAVFAGTRVPIDIVLGSMAAGVDMDRLRASYPFLTDAHLQAARVYDEVHPRRGRPKRLSEANPPATRASPESCSRPSHDVPVADRRVPHTGTKELNYCPCKAGFDRSFSAETACAVRDPPHR